MIDPGNRHKLDIHVIQINKHGVFGGEASRIFEIGDANNKIINAKLPGQFPFQFLFVDLIPVTLHQW